MGGVLEIISYNDENITMYTALGNLRIGGENLEVGTAFSENGTVEITGYIRTIHFCDGKSGYAEIYEDMKWNARYLFEYGHALHKLHRNEESNVVMKEALKVSGDPMILNIIGKNEQEAGNYAEAEYWLIRSTHRLPGRIYPYFLLAKLYAEPGFYQRQKLEQAARMVMEKEPKVQSTAIRQMREEIKKLL